MIVHYFDTHLMPTKFETRAVTPLLTQKSTSAHWLAAVLAFFAFGSLFGNFCAAQTTQSSSRLLQLQQFIAEKKYAEAMEEATRLQRLNPADQRLFRIRLELTNKIIATSSTRPIADQTAVDAAPKPASNVIEGQDRLDLDTAAATMADLAASLGKGDDPGPSERLATELLQRTEPLVQKYPRIIELWVYRGWAAIVLDRLREGVDAGDHLKSLGALSSNKDAVNKVMPQLNRRGWLRDGLAEALKTPRLKLWDVTDELLNGVSAPAPFHVILRDDAMTMRQYLEAGHGDPNLDALMMVDGLPYKPNLLEFTIHMHAMRCMHELIVHGAALRTANHSAIAVAAQREDCEALELLLEKGANVGNWWGSAPIEGTSNGTIARLLIERGSPQDANIRALEGAARQCDEKMVAQFVACHVEVASCQSKVDQEIERVRGKNDPGLTQKFDKLLRIREILKSN